MADEVDEALAARETALRADLRSLVDGRAVRASARRAHMVLHAPPGGGEGWGEGWGEGKPK